MIGNGIFIFEGRRGSVDMSSSKIRKTNHIVRHVNFSRGTGHGETFGGAIMMVMMMLMMMIRRSRTGWGRHF